MKMNNIVEATLLALQGKLEEEKVQPIVVETVEENDIKEIQDKVQDMNNQMEEKAQRTKNLKMMDRVARRVNDEDIFEYWLMMGIPDGASDDEFPVWADNMEDYNEFERVFKKLLKAAKEDGLYDASEEEYEFAKKYEPEIINIPKYKIPEEVKDEKIEESTTIDSEEDYNELAQEYKDAYHKDLDMKTVPCVIARDKMLSGWGGASGRTHYQVVLCGNSDEAYNISHSMNGVSKREQLTNIRLSTGVKLSSNASVSYAIGRNAHAWNDLSDGWYAKEFDNKEIVEESIEPQNIKVKSFDRYDNGMEVDIIIGQLEDGRYFEMLADTTTGISIFKQGFNPMTIEGKWILDGKESENQELDNEILANNTELSFEPKENKELWNTIVKDIDTSLLLETAVKYYYYEINFDYTEDTGKDSDGYSIFFKSTTDVDDYDDIINLAQELNELDEDELADVDYIYYAQQIDEDEYNSATKANSVVEETVERRCLGKKVEEAVEMKTESAEDRFADYLVLKDENHEYWSKVLLFDHYLTNGDLERIKKAVNDVKELVEDYTNEEIEEAIDEVVPYVDEITLYGDDKAIFF
jgi:hypothetical protein